MSGIIAVYGLVIAVLIANDMGPTNNESLFTYVPSAYLYFRYAGLLTEVSRGFCHLCAGLSVGLSGLAAGYTIGIVGDAVSFAIVIASRVPMTDPCSSGCTRVYATISGVRGNDPDYDLW